MTPIVHRRRVVLATLALLCFRGAPTGAETDVCADPRVTVEAESSKLVGEVCRVVAKARRQLNACHLYQSHPIRFVIGREGQFIPNGCFGGYEVQSRTIRLHDPTTLARMIAADPFWGRVSVDSLFSSLIVHELSHAYLHDMGGATEHCVLDHEYIAYAMQLSWLAPQERVRLLAVQGDSPKRDTSYLNDFILFGAPDVFVQAVWTHFSAPENGCAFVRRLVDGETTLFVDFS